MEILRIAYESMNPSAVAYVEQRKRDIKMRRRERCDAVQLTERTNYQHPLDKFIGQNLDAGV
ncbi:hypothetical protein J4463_02930 [Candidatus Pacearchaeota archaeon]|nr:hypothetical protein [Candidatus Pacearchaeota archaeon]